MILGPDGKPFQPIAHRDAPKVPRLKARYDAAQTNSENAKHWAWADALSADAANSADVREKLRNRSRYEVANNSFARGIVDFIAADTISKSVRLRLLTQETAGAGRRSQSPSPIYRKTLLTAADASFVEGEFFAWMQEVGGWEKLRTAQVAEVQDGEGFGVLVSNQRLESPVKIAPRLLEAEMVADLMASLPERDRVNGIRYDSAGNPIAYRVLRDHPGGSWGSMWGEADWINAEYITHIYEVQRAGQRRGIPKLTPCLPLFAQLRRFTLAVIAAAETAADFAAVLHTTQSPDEGGVQGEPFESIEIERRMMMTLPDGYDMRQFKAEQPVASYGEFVRNIVREINRALETPLNIALGDSSEYNYASGKLDWQIWQKARAIRRERVCGNMLRPWFTAWIKEARLIEGYLPQAARMGNVDWSTDWLFGGDVHQDPIREASAQELRLQNNTTTLAQECGAQGLDWEEVLEQRAREKQRLRELGMDHQEAISAAAEQARLAAIEADERPLSLMRDEQGRLAGLLRGS